MIMDMQCSVCHKEISQDEVSRSLGGAGLTFLVTCDEHRGKVEFNDDDGLE